MVDSELSYLFIWILSPPTHLLPHPIVATVFYVCFSNLYLNFFTGNGGNDEWWS